MNMNAPINRVRNKRLLLTRWFRRAVLGATGLAVAAAIGLAWMPQPVPVDTAIVARGPMRVSVDEDGLARVKDRYVISAPLSGNLARIELDAGDTVKPAQIVARIMPLLPPLLDERSRSGAVARVAATSASQNQIRAQIARAEANLEFAKTEAARNRELRRRGAIAQPPLEQSLLAERAAHAELDSLRFGVRVADHELEMAKAAVARLRNAKAKGEELRVTSPVAGQVLKVLHENEGAVQASTPLVEVGDPGALEIAVDVLTGDAVRIAPGAKVVVDRWGGSPLEGRVRRVEPAAFTRLSALGVEEQRVNVLIDLVSPREKWAALGDGYRVEAAIVVWEAADVVKAPASAVFRRDEKWAVYRIDDGRARSTSVEIGHRTARDVEIVQGLAPGSEVIVHPGDRITDGVEVERR
jgi:HlyD family secretion protein